MASTKGSVLNIRLREEVNGPLRARLAEMRRELPGLTLSVLVHAALSRYLGSNPESVTKLPPGVEDLFTTGVLEGLVQGAQPGISVEKSDFLNTTKDLLDLISEKVSDASDFIRRELDRRSQEHQEQE